MMQAHVELYREELGDRYVYPGHDGDDIYIPPKPGKWRWRFKKGRNIMADSGQGYSRRIDCLRSCAVVLGGIYYRKGGEYYRAGEHIHRHVSDGTWDFARGIKWEYIEVRDLTREDG